jgi:hypothetical protein
MKVFEMNQKVKYKGKVYDFGYYSLDGMVVLYNEGERNMQDSFAVPEKFVRYNTEHEAGNMEVITSDMPIKEPPLGTQRVKSGIFLAGPTPRDENTISWRRQALAYLEEFGYNGIVYVPERKDWKVKFEYSDQIEWELRAMNICSTIVFWVPRELKHMPAFTTNVEFGMTIREPWTRMLYGRPKDAEKCRYLDYLYDHTFNKQPHDSLYYLLEDAVNGKD